MQEPPRRDLAPPVSIENLIVSELLPSDYVAFVASVIAPLGLRIAKLQGRAARPVLIGVNGAQGSGKTTLCRFLDEVVLPTLGLHSLMLSLDDFYLTQEERRRLSRDLHPLLATRGVPGTHDIRQLLQVLDAVMGRRLPVAVPRFAKDIDDRMPPSAWAQVVEPPDVILLEGWCVGAEPQSADSLEAPVNKLEAMEDPAGLWRSYANDQLGSAYRRLHDRLDALVMVCVPSFEHVWEGRKRQEDKLRESARDVSDGVMSDAELLRFIQHYERLTRHMLTAMPPRADAIISGSDISFRGRLAQP